MAHIWYLGPCRSEEDLYLLIYGITSHLDRAGASFHVPECNGVSIPLPRTSGNETAESVARLILKADGKSFVPVTRGEYLDQAVGLGFFPRNTAWKEPMTKEDAAILAVKLKESLERRVSK